MADDHAEETGSTLPRRQLGRYLKEAREGAGFTLERAASLMEWNKSTLSRLERGLTEKVRVRDVSGLCEIYGLTDENAAVAKGLAEQTPAKAWWHAYGDLIPAWFNLYVGLEAAAEELAIFQPLLIPGLLQTRDYARAIDRRYFTEDSDEELERRVQLRVQRQHILTRSRRPTKALFVLQEAVLRTVVGDRNVMSPQLRHLADVGTLANIELRILPFHAGIPVGMPLPPFTILDFAPDVRGRFTEPPVIYCESYTGSAYLEGRTDVLRFRQAFDVLQQSSLDSRLSRALLREIAREFERDR
ncbi:helix-turn-helix domain-containing protein [Nocardia beijingensis]|uniref:helix-turn-helix domain-containing protein n=1 Tax=Nocardia beijingensis TaxID=95162 RepID=UPI001893544F|nr:helix-turn-helix transcriptional regulator [Nocardia beijingensis]MBF6077268.1 helix-turn-helix domain-containing protein [Nocardia beijingensis]